jgi:hypothetical protein
MYDHYIGLDWAKSNMAIARMTKHEDKIRDNKDVPSDIKDLKAYLSLLKGKTILTFEETTSAHWLYTELCGCVTEIIVCNPHRNHLLSEGGKTDKIDAAKLVRLLKANMLKPVFHSGEFFFHLRKLTSGYEDLVKVGVRTKNQASALFRGLGISKESGEVKSPYDVFVFNGQQKMIDLYEAEKKRYESEFSKLHKSNPLIKNLATIPGIGSTNAVKLTAILVDANRFKNKSAWLSFCGLVRLEKMSGGRSYGTRLPNYNRVVKSIFKSAAIVAIQNHLDNCFRDYYQDLITKKNYPNHNARHAVARRIAVVALGVFRNNKPFKDEWRCAANHKS